MEPSMQRVLMATRSGSAQQPVVTSHSLSLESGFLAEQPAYLLPPLRPPGAPAFQRATQVSTTSIDIWCEDSFDGQLLGICRCQLSA